MHVSRTGTVRRLTSARAAAFTAATHASPAPAASTRTAASAASAHPRSSTAPAPCSATSAARRKTLASTTRTATTPPIVLAIPARVRGDANRSMVARCSLLGGHTMRSSIALWLLVVCFVTAIACGGAPLGTGSGSAGGAGAAGATSGSAGATSGSGTAGATGIAGTPNVSGSAGATGSGAETDGDGGDGAADAGACGDPYANSSMPLAPCAVDSDCHSAYLFCGAPQGTVDACRDADAAVDDCAPPAFADLPICPMTKQITANLCGIRYQRPCNIDSDCGPGLTCDLSGASTCPAGPCGTCQTPPPAACVTNADCPKEWDCYAACACTPNEQTHCFPPFEIFHCPECAPTPGP